MDESIDLNLENEFPIVPIVLPDSVIETINSITETFDEIVETISKMVKPIMKIIQEMLHSFYDAIGRINFSTISTQFYFTDFATADVSNTETRRNQLPKKIIEEEHFSNLSFSYSVIYGDYSSNNSHSESVNSKESKKVSNNKNAPLSENSLLSSNDLVLTVSGVLASALFMLVDKNQIGMHQAFLLFFSFLTIFYKEN